MCLVRRNGLHVIPSFDVLQVELRQMPIRAYTADDEEKHYDFFIRNSPSLCTLYPAWMVVKDATIVKVRFILLVAS